MGPVRLTASDGQTPIGLVGAEDGLVRLAEVSVLLSKSGGLKLSSYIQNVRTGRSRRRFDSSRNHLDVACGVPFGETSYDKMRSTAICYDDLVCAVVLIERVFFGHVEYLWFDIDEGGNTPSCKVIYEVIHGVREGGKEERALDFI